MQTSKIKLKIYLAVWKRPEITELCFMGIHRLKTHLSYDISAFAVISEEDMIPLCEKYGIDWVLTENLPLGKKKNYGLKQLADYDFDFLMEIGSDDLVTNDLLDQYLPYFNKYDFFGISDAAYIESESGEFSTGNLVFKLLRRNGYVEKVMDMKNKSYDQQFK